MFVDWTCGMSAEVRTRMSMSKDAEAGEQWLAQGCVRALG